MSEEARISAKDAATRWQVTPRTLRNWCKEGCPSEMDGRNRLFLPSAVEKWLHGRGDAAPTAAGGKKNRPPEPPGDPADVSVEAIVTGRKEDRDLIDILGRLKSLERDAFSQLSAVVRDPESTTQLVDSYQKRHLAVVDQLRKFEQVLHSILVERGEFISATEVSTVVAKAVAAMVAELERLGIICGDRIAAMVDGSDRTLHAGDYRALIDDTVALTVTRLRSSLEALCQDLG